MHIPEARARMRIGWRLESANWDTLGVERPPGELAGKDACRRSTVRRPALILRSFFLCSRISRPTAIIRAILETLEARQRAK